jgi:protein-S-isoprenylcysteine O-methyltransferase Ste14
MPDFFRVLAKWRVPLGFLCGVVVLWMARPTFLSVAIGGTVAAVGEMLRIWAAGHLEKGSEITRSGPYRFTRHPLYLGSAIVGAGAAVAAQRLSVAALTAGYLGLTILSAIRTEEARMRASFGDQYDAYLQSRAKPVDRRFSLDRAIRNKEYRAVAGLAAVAGLLAVKAALR